MCGPRKSPPASFVPGVGVKSRGICKICKDSPSPVPEGRCLQQCNRQCFNFAKQQQPCQNEYRLCKTRLLHRSSGAQWCGCTRHRQNRCSVVQAAFEKKHNLQASYSFQTSTVSSPAGNGTAIAVELDIVEVFSLHVHLDLLVKAKRTSGLRLVTAEHSAYTVQPLKRPDVSPLPWKKRPKYETR